MSMEAEAGIFMGIECAVSGPDGKIVCTLSLWLLIATDVICCVSSSGPFKTTL